MAGHFRVELKFHPSEGCVLSCWTNGRKLGSPLQIRTGIATFVALSLIHWTNGPIRAICAKLVENRGVEPRLDGCRPSVLPLSLVPHGCGPENRTLLEKLMRLP